MDFPGPEPADLAHVAAINREFLAFATSPEGSDLRTRLPAALCREFAGLEGGVRERIARAPFLLGSVHERDAERWSPGKRSPGGPDLIDRLARPVDGEFRVLCATLAFLSELARRNPYAARVVSGAPLPWCESMAELTSVDLYDIAATGAGLLTFRHAENPRFWQRLLSAGASEQAGVRHAARLSALHAILTRPEPPGAGRLPAAACAMPVPQLRVAERSAMSQSERRGYNTPPDACPIDKKSRKDVPER